jgi:iron(III) transport system ATP-binding protein
MRSAEQIGRSADTPRAGIAVEALTKQFGRNAVVLHGVDLAIAPGEFICLLGPSGCGKTTLLRCIAGLEHPDDGRISIGNRLVVDAAQKVFVSPEQRQLGMVFQHYALWPHMTVGDNIGYPLRKRGVARAQRDEKIRQIMKVVGLPDVLDRRPSQLSGGQQQRVALARALVYEPPVLLLDEPLSNLDATLRTQLRRELRHLHERLGMTTILVTHDQEEASAVADSIAVMHHGRIIQRGSTSDVFRRPRTRFVAEFVGFDNFIPGRVVEHRTGRALIALDSGAKFDVPASEDCALRGRDVIVVARSGALQLQRLEGPQTDQGMARGVIRRVTAIGHGIEFEVALGDQIIIVRHGESVRSAPFEPGTEVLVDFLSEPVMLPAETAIDEAN